MKSIQYETHSNHQYLNSRCPFRLGYNENIKESSYNWHENPEIIYVTNGSGIMQYNSVNYPLREGTIFVVNPDMLHYVFSSSGISFYFIIIDKQFFLENGFTPERYSFIPEIHDSEIEKGFIKTVNAIERLIKKNDEMDTAKVRKELLTLLIALYSRYSVVQNTEDKKKKKAAVEYIKEALKFINAHYTEQITLEQIAEQQGITKYYLLREFKKYTDQTVVSYINMLRCRNAEVYLAKGFSVTESAYKSGFESSSYFTRTYKKFRGYSPSEYKKNTKSKTSNLKITSS